MNTLFSPDSTTGGTWSGRMPVIAPRLRARTSDASRPRASVGTSVVPERWRAAANHRILEGLHMRRLVERDRIPEFRDQQAGDFPVAQVGAQEHDTPAPRPAPRVTGASPMISVTCARTCGQGRPQT
jgi:hypothetical protein